MRRVVTATSSNKYHCIVLIFDATVHATIRAIYSGSDGPIKVTACVAGELAGEPCMRAHEKAHILQLGGTLTLTTAWRLGNG